MDPTKDTDDLPPYSQQTGTEEIPLQPFDWLTSAASIGSLIQPLLQAEDNRILHVGCGSSILGEWIVEHCNPQVSKVVNVDCDVDTLLRMQRRWQDRVLSLNGNSEMQHNTLCEAMMDFIVADFTIPNVLSSMQSSFDVIIDKSTLDCMLCTDTGAVGLLLEVYRLLKENAVYLVVSFHPPEFIEVLLSELPGADWDVTCSILPRQMEEFPNSVHVTEEVSLPLARVPIPSSLVGSVGTITVLYCRRRKWSDSVLDWDTVYQHVHSVNQHWYQQTNPLLTVDRIKQIERDFTDAGELNLRRCYQVLFTDGERENLDYEDFVGDWMSFLVEKSCSEPEIPVDRMSFATAVEFLRAMQ